MEVTRKAFGRVVYRYVGKGQTASDVMQAFAESMAENLPGEFRVVLPGNGGITSIEFRSSEVPATVDQN